MANRYRLPIFAQTIGLSTGTKSASVDGWFYPVNAAEEAALQAMGCVQDDTSDGQSVVPSGQLTATQSTAVSRGVMPDPMNAPYVRTFGGLRTTFAALSPRISSWAWAHLVDNQGIPHMNRALARFYIYFATDHSDTEDGVRLLYSDSLAGPWTLWLGGKDPTDPAIVYWDRDATGAGNALSTETPSIIDDMVNGRRILAYQSKRPGYNGNASATDLQPNFGVTLSTSTNLTDPLGRASSNLVSTNNPVQATLFAVNADNTGTSFTKHRTSMLFPGTTVTGGMWSVGNHTGYLGALSRIGDKIVGHTIGGSNGQVRHTCQYDDPLNWRSEIFQWEGASRAFSDAGYPGYNFAPQKGGYITTLNGLVWVGGASSRTADTYTIFAAMRVREDLNTFYGGVRILDVFPSKSWDLVDTDSRDELTSWSVIDGKVTGVVMSGIQTTGSAADNFSIIQLG